VDTGLASLHTLNWSPADKTGPPLDGGVVIARLKSHRHQGLWD
jgi:hypothetical protein